MQNLLTSANIPSTLALKYQDVTHEIDVAESCAQGVYEPSEGRLQTAIAYESHIHQATSAVLHVLSNNPPASSMRAKATLWWGHVGQPWLHSTAGTPVWCDPETQTQAQAAELPHRPHRYSGSQANFAAVARNG